MVRGRYGGGVPAVRMHKASWSGRLGGRRVEIRLTCPGGERARGPTPSVRGGTARQAGRDRAEGTGRRTPIAVSRWRGRPARRWVLKDAAAVSVCMQPVRRPTAVCAGWATQWGTWRAWVEPVCRPTAVCGRLGDTVLERRRTHRGQPPTPPVALSVRHLAMSPRHLARRPDGTAPRHVPAAPAPSLEGARSAPGRERRGRPPGSWAAGPRTGAGGEVPLDGHVGGRGRLSEEI